MKLLHVVGARPNFMKLAPVYAGLAQQGAVQVVVHTGQHYDDNMSGIFFRQFGLRQPEHNLRVGAGSHTQQTAHTMLALEPLLLQEQPSGVVVYGDVNSTVAAALVCAKLGIHLSHVEAGLRSFDRSMPEEINRVVTDRLSDLLFTPSEDGNTHLLQEGVSVDKIHFVGNVMIDTLRRFLPTAMEVALPPLSERYVLVTLHRPSNVDEPTRLLAIMQALHEMAHEIAVVFPIHPRTRKQLEQLAGYQPHAQLQLWQPAGYLEFLQLQQRAALVITDSGGVQEETTALQVPCITLRPNTERPITIAMGTNTLFNAALHKLPALVRTILNGHYKQGQLPPLWDGQAGARIAEVLLRKLAAKA